MPDQTNSAFHVDKPPVVWMTRSPVPAASGVAWALGWIGDEFARDGIEVRRVNEGGLNIVTPDPEHLGQHLFREGGNIKALAARAFGVPTRVVGLTWIDERQVILTRSGTPVLEPGDLKGMRFALPGFSRTPGESIARAMALRGITSVLALGGLTLNDVRLVEIPAPPFDMTTPQGMQRMWLGLEWLAQGKVDAAYAKGATAAEMADRLGLEAAVELDAYPSRMTRINNGTPRPIVVHQHMLDEHFDLVVRFLAQTLRAADWAATHPAELKPILASDTIASLGGVESAYRGHVLRALHPDLSADRIDMLRMQAQFLWAQGFLQSPVDVASWIDPAPLAAAIALLSRGYQPANSVAG
jgi:ABC-type nitrate/sulfonate/bicarbonate transport system substrate-binding protein